MDLGLGRLEQWQTDLSCQGGSNPSTQGFPGSSDDKDYDCNAGDPGSIPRSGRSPGEGSGYPLQYSCLENPMGRGACELQSMGL